MIGIALLVAVIIGLAVTIRAQIRPMRRLRTVLDAFAIVPEWRFYAQASIKTTVDLARDPHLIVRDRDAAGRIGGWNVGLCHAERRMHHAWWNPHARVNDVVLGYAMDLAHARVGDRYLQQSIRYIAVLRCILQLPRGSADSVDRQFAVVHTIGRGQRTIAIDVVSGWHRW